MSQFDTELARLYAEQRERARLRAEAYWKNPPPPLTEEQQRERDQSRRAFATWARCDISQVVWHGPDQCWSFR